MSEPKHLATYHWGGNKEYEDMDKKEDIQELCEMLRIMQYNRKEEKYCTEYIDAHLNAINNQILKLIEIYG